jgi:hypothetical protein
VVLLRVKKPLEFIVPINKQWTGAKKNGPIPEMFQDEACLVHISSMLQYPLYTPRALLFANRSNSSTSSYTRHIERAKNLSNVTMTTKTPAYCSDLQEIRCGRDTNDLL